MIHPFRIDVPDKTLEQIRTQVANYPWHEMPDDGGWAYGTHLGYMKELCAYWLNEFDWRKQEAAINRFSHFIAPVQGIDLHFIQEKGDGPSPLPLIISHGWPGSIVEFLDIIPDGPHGPEEEAWAVQFEHDQLLENGYRTQQATKPQTLSYAMMDSPVGVAAWIIEKFNSWSDTEGDNIESAHTKDSLLTNIMVYLVTKTFNTASWIYYGRREEGGRLLSTDNRRVEVPTAAALFPAELLAWPPRSYVERLYNISHWSEMPRGGHFAALEEPELLIDDIRAFARTLR